MLRERVSLRRLPPVSTLVLFFFLSACVMKGTPPQESPPQETSPAADAGKEGVTEAEAGKAGVTEAEAGKQEATEAEAALTAALTEAEKDGRLVFLHTGADW